MLVLKILAASAAIFLAAGVLQVFEARVSKRYGARFLTKSAAVAWILASSLLAGGYYWWQSTVATGGDQLNGIVLMSLGAAAIIGTLVWNIRSTNLLIGVVGTLLQASIFSVLALFGVIGATVSLVLFFVAVLGARPVYVVGTGGIRRR